MQLSMGTSVIHLRLLVWAPFPNDPQLNRHRL